MDSNCATLQTELKHRIDRRTGGRVRDLAVEMDAERVVLHGRAPNYYVKQLAQHGVLELLPQIGLSNVIIVEEAASSVPLSNPFSANNLSA
jgi:hypothetical protein